MSIKNLLNSIAIIALLISNSNVKANVKPNSLFTDNMVLQRGVTVPVWGTAKDGETITVTFAGQRQTTAAANGKWMIKLEALKEGGPFEMIIKGENIISFGGTFGGSFG